MAIHIIFTHDNIFNIATHPDIDIGHMSLH